MRRRPIGTGTGLQSLVHSVHPQGVFKWVLATVCALCLALPMAAQSPAESHATEWAFTSGGAADLPGGARGGDFWAMQFRWGKVLSAPHGPGALRGSFEYVFELVPAMVMRQTCTVTSTVTLSGISASLNGQSSSPPHGCAVTSVVLDTTSTQPSSFSINDASILYGGGFNPFFWQYNFVHDSQQRFVPYIQAGAGMLFTTEKFPAGTSQFNFTPQGGFGAYWFSSEHRAASFGVRYHHISNAGITKPNPGHNSLYFYAGLSWWK